MKTGGSGIVDSIVNLVGGMLSMFATRLLFGERRTNYENNYPHFNETGLKFNLLAWCSSSFNVVVPCDV